MFKFIITFIICLISLIISTPVSAGVDTDVDGLTDDTEISLYATDPALSDTDADGFSDATEIKHGYSPRFLDKKMTEVDSDEDYLPDSWEIALGTGIKDPDSDGDKYLDGTEVRAGFDPLNSDKLAKLEKIITINLSSQSLSYSFGGKNLETFPISSGLPATPTPKGEFSVITKRALVNYRGTNYNYPNTKWNLRFAWGKGFSYYIHGAYWHNNFGKPMSHGCINVSYANMERLYTWAQEGTKIIITK